MQLFEIRVTIETPEGQEVELSFPFFVNGSLQRVDYDCILHPKVDEMIHSIVSPALLNGSDPAYEGLNLTCKIPIVDLNREFSPEVKIFGGTTADEMSDRLEKAMVSPKFIKHLPIPTEPELEPEPEPKPPSQDINPDRRVQSIDIDFSSLDAGF